jgi:lipoyl(octanoyl) transferase
MSTPARDPELWVCHLGVVEYHAALELQSQLRERRQAEEIPDLLLTLEHPPVYTRGRRAGDDELPLGEAFYRAQGIDIVDTPRGGRVTYHGPGQLVGYPIMRIDDVVAYLREMEQAIIAALAQQQIDAQVRDGLTGVWVADRKIASIGLHVRRGVTTHGFAINVDNDLAPFGWIVPCGISDVTMTSVTQEAGHHVGTDCMRREAAHAFAQTYGRRQRLVSSHRLFPDGLPVAAAVVEPALA